MNLNLNSILIVNSEPDLADLFAEMLSMDVEKYIINIAYTGKKCLSTLKKYIPDLILLDIELSDIDGWDLIEEIKKSQPDIPIIVITAKPPGIEDFSRLAIVSDYLMKPVTIDGFHMAVRDALEIPFILDNCIETLRNSQDKEEGLYLLEKKIRLIKQSIINRKLFILMRQLYLDKKINNYQYTKIFLDRLRKKIDMERNELETFNEIFQRGGKCQVKY